MKLRKHFGAAASKFKPKARIFKLKNVWTPDESYQDVDRYLASMQGNLLQKINNVEINNVCSNFQNILKAEGKSLSFLQRYCNKDFFRKNDKGRKGNSHCRCKCSE